MRPLFAYPSNPSENGLPIQDFASFISELRGFGFRGLTTPMTRGVTRVGFPRVMEFELSDKVGTPTACSSRGLLLDYFWILLVKFILIKTAYVLRANY